MSKPVKYDPKFCQELIDHCKKGHDISSFGSVIEVSRATLYLWMKKYPDFKFAHEQGIGWLKKQAMDTLWDFANGDKPKGASVLAAIYIAKLYGYREDKPLDADLDDSHKQLENKNEIRLSYNLEKKATLEELKKEELMTEAEFTEIIQGEEIEEQGQSEEGKEEL